MASELMSQVSMPWTISPRGRRAGVTFRGEPLNSATGVASPARASAPALEQLLVGHLSYHTRGNAHDQRPGRHVAGDHRAGGHERLLADLDAGQEHGTTTDPAGAPEHRAPVGLIASVATHRVVVGGADPGGDEDVVLDRAAGGDVSVGLD